MKGSVLILCLFLFNELRISALAIWLAINKSKEPKDKKNSALSASSAVETEKLEGKKDALQ